MSVFLATSCVGLYAGAMSESTSYEGAYSWKSPGKMSDEETFDLIMKSAEEQGYHLAKDSRDEDNTIHFTSSSSGANTTFTGRSQRVLLWFKVNHGKIRIKTMLTGNYSFGSKENSDELIEQFKRKMKEIRKKD